MVVDADPLLKFNEEYVLFLRADKRTYPYNRSGSPRYSAVGDWSVKAKIVNGKIQFLSAAHKRLHHTCASLPRCRIMRRCYIKHDFPPGNRHEHPHIFDVLFRARE